MVKRKPQWVPEWAWGQYLQACKLCDREAERALYDKIINTAECEVIWNTLGRRNAKQNSLTAIYGHISYLLMITYEATLGPYGAELVAASERKKMSARISKLVAALQHDLKQIENDAAELPAEFRESIDDFTSGKIREARSFYCGLLRDHVAGNKANAIASAIEEAAANLDTSIELNARTIVGFLGAIQDGAEKWAATRPPISHMAGKNANQLYFIRSLTKYMREAYGTPLREAVAILTNAVYGCGMDSATVAKLAP